MHTFLSWPPTADVTACQRPVVETCRQNINTMEISSRAHFCRAAFLFRSLYVECNSVECINVYVYIYICVYITGSLTSMFLRTVLASNKCTVTVTGGRLEKRPSIPSKKKTQTKMKMKAKIKINENKSNQINNSKNTISVNSIAPTGSDTKQHRLARYSIFFSLSSTEKSRNFPFFKSPICRFFPRHFISLKFSCMQEDRFH